MDVIDILISITLSIMLLSLANPFKHNITYIKDNVAPIISLLWFIFSMCKILLKLLKIYRKQRSRFLLSITVSSAILYIISYLLPYSNQNDIKSNLHVDSSLLTCILLAIACIYLIKYFPSYYLQLSTYLFLSFIISVYIIITFEGINTVSELVFFHMINFYLYFIEDKLVDKDRND